MNHSEVLPHDVSEALLEALEGARSAPQHIANWLKLDEAVRETEQPEEASALYRKMLEEDLPTETLMSLGEQAVAFHEEWFSDPERLTSVLRRLVRIDSQCEWAFERLSLLLTLDERWDDLLAEYDHVLSRTQDPDRTHALLDEAARIAKDFAGQAPRASEYLKQLLLNDPSNGQLAGSLERRLEQQCRHEDLIEVWQARLPFLSPQEALDTRVRIAQRHLAPLGNAEKSLSAAEEILELPDGEPAAIELLERIAGSADAAAPARRRALSLLRQRYADSERADDVIRVLRLWLTVSESTDTTLELHEAATRWLVQSSRLAEAMDHASARLELSPGDASVHEELRGLAERTDDYKRYAEALMAAADACPNGDRRVPLMLEAGDVVEHRLADAGAATEHYLRVLADPDATESAQLLAARKARPLLERAERSAPLLQVLERLADLEPDLSGQRETLCEAAHLAAAEDDIDRSLSLWQRCLELSDQDREALDARVELLERAGRWEALIGDLRRRARLEESREKQRADWIRIATLYEHELGRMDSAIEVWRDIERQFSVDSEIVDALVRLCQSDQRHEELVELLGRSLETEKDPARRTSQLSLLGDVYRTRKLEPAAAVEHYRQALEIQPDHAPALGGLRALLSEPECQEIAVETLAEALSRADDWQGVLELLPQRVEAASRTERKHQILLEAARVKEERAEDLEGSLECLCAAFELDPTPELEQSLLRVAAISGNFERAAAGMSAAVAQCADPQRQLSLQLSRGQLLERELSNTTEALASYRAILESDPQHTEAAAAAARVAIELGAFAELGETVVSHAEAIGGLDPSLAESVERAADTAQCWPDITQAILLQLSRQAAPREAKVEHDLRRQLGLWYENRCGDADQAVALLGAAARYFPNASTLQTLAALQRSEPGSALVQTLLALADVSDDDLPVLHEAAQVSLKTEQAPQTTRPILERALKAASGQQRNSGASAPGIEAQAPSSAAPGAEAARADSSPGEVAWWALQQLVSLDQSQGEFRSALDLLREGTTLPFSTDRRVQLDYQAAQVAAGPLEDTGLAVEIGRGALQQDAEHAPTIDLLSDLFEKEQRYDDLLDLRRKELDLQPSLERRLKLRLDVARILKASGQRRAQQLRVLRQNVQEAVGHAESIDGIEEILLARGAHRPLRALLVSQADAVAAAGNRGAAAALWARAGMLSETALGDLEQAVAALRASVALEPQPESLDALARLYLTQDRPAEAIGWLEQRLALAPREAVEARRNTLETLTRALCAAGEESRARDYLSNSLEADPGALKLRKLLGDLYRKREDWQLLAPLLTGGVDYAPDDATRVEFLREAARVQRRHLGDLEEALPLLRRAVDLDPEDRGLRLGLADALRHGRQFDEARGLLQGLLEEFGRRRTKDRARVHYHLAQIARSSGDLDTALTELNEAASVDRHNVHMLKLLGDVARERGKLEEAERAYRTLLLLLGRHRQQEHDDQPAIGESSVLFELYRIATERGQGERAKELLDSALESGAHDDAEARRLEQALREAGHNDLLLRALERRMARTEDPIARSEILRARADVLVSLDRNEEALECRLEALSKGTASSALVTKTFEVSEVVGKVDEVVERVGALAERALETDPSRACELWLALGALTAQRGDVRRGSELLRRAQATGFRAYECLAQVEAIGGGLLEPEALADSYRLFVETADSTLEADKYTDVLYRLGELEIEQGRAERGTLRVEAALARNQDYARGVSLLRRTLEATEPSPQVVELLEQTAREKGDEDALLVALSHRADLGDATVELLQEAVALARARADEETQERLLARTVELAQQRTWVDDALWAVSGLVLLQTKRGKQQEAAALLHNCIERASPLPAFELKLQLATLVADEIGDLDRATTLYEELLAEEPTSGRVWRPLLQVYRRKGDQDALEARIAKLENQLTDEDQRRSLHLERIQILIDSDKLEEAETSLREHLEQHPESDEAADVLEVLLEASNRHAELRQSIEARLERARESKSEDAVARFTLRLGALLREQDPPAAVRAFQESFDAGCRAPALLSGYLEALNESQGACVEQRSAVMLALLEQQSGEQAETQALELARLMDEEGDRAGFERAVDTGLERCPSSLALHEKLVTWCEKHGAWSRLAEQLTARAKHESDRHQAQALLLRAASLYDERLSEPRLGAEALQQAAEVQDPDPALLRRVADAWLGASEPELALKPLSQAIEAHSEVDRIGAELLSKRASVRLELWPDRLEEVAASVKDLTQAAASEPALALEELASALAGYTRLLGDADSERGKEEHRSATMQLTRALVQLGRTDEAAERLGLWLRDQEGDADALTQLGALAAEQGDFERAADAYQTLIPLVEGEQQVEAALRLADCCQRAGRPMAAQAALVQVYRAQPAQKAIRERLGNIYEGAQAYRELASLWVTDSENAELSDDERFEARCNAGACLMKAEGGAPEARKVLEGALELRPDSAAALVRVADAMVLMGEVEEAAHKLDEVIRAHGKRRSPELAELQHAMARIARAASDEEAEFAWLEAALYSDRQNGAVAAELATLAMDRRQFDVAIKALQLVTLLKSPGPMSRAEAYLRQAVIAQTRQDLKRAALLAKRAVTTDPGYDAAQAFLEDLNRQSVSVPPPTHAR